ncbi:MAG: DUF3794 domain-containing protein [Clostridia bacterium]|nr:DUF3794 domain-containing protein [Clostridia bacterium]
MDLQTATGSLHTTETLYDSFEERAVDVDFVLPDYCAEVAAVLKCTMTPVITQRQWSADRLSVDGFTTIRVLYLDEERRTVHAYEAKEPFALSFSVSTEGEGVHRLLEAKTDYVNCRATSARHLNVHGAFRVYLKIIGEGVKTIFSDPGSPTLFCKAKTVRTSAPVLETEKSFTVNEFVALGMPAYELIYSHMTASVSDCKKLLGKMIVKGTLILHALYTANEDGESKTVTQEIPYSQIVDVEGMTEEWLCDVSVGVGECEAHIQREQTGGVLAITCKLTAFVRCSRTEVHSVVLDAYDIHHPLACETIPMPVKHRGPRSVRRVRTRQSMPLPDGVSDIVDLWAEARRETVSGDEMSGDIQISLLARDSENRIGYYERTLAAEWGRREDGPAVAEIRVLFAQGRMSGGMLEVETELEIAEEDVFEETLAIVASAVMDEQETYPPSEVSLKILYTSAGEDLWELAKACRTSLDDILLENDLTQPVIQRPTMLMIPIQY